MSFYAKIHNYSGFLLLIPCLFVKSPNNTLASERKTANRSTNKVTQSSCFESDCLSARQILQSNPITLSRDFQLA